MAGFLVASTFLKYHWELNKGNLTNELSAQVSHFHITMPEFAPEMDSVFLKSSKKQPTGLDAWLCKPVTMEIKNVLEFNNLERSIFIFYNTAYNCRI